MADVFVGSDTHLGLVKYGERQSAEITEQRGFLARLRKHNPVGRGAFPVKHQAQQFGVHRG